MVLHRYLSDQYKIGSVSNYAGSFAWTGPGEQKLEKPTTEPGQLSINLYIFKMKTM
jgi:hypothetical protein